MPATRVEIADLLDGAFTAGPRSRDELLGVVGRAGARPQVLGVLTRLPAGPFHELRNIWGSIPDVPIDNDVTVPAPEPAK